MGHEIEQASALFDPADLGPVRDLLTPLVESGDLDAAITLGTFLTMSDSPLDFVEGLNILKGAVQRGSALAANNLSTALHVAGPELNIDPTLAEHYAALARRLGFPNKPGSQTPKPEPD